LGYSLGRKSEPAITTASAATTPQTVPGTNKASSGTSTAAPPMTFYKSVEQKDASPELTPPADAKTETPAATTPASGPDPTTTLPTGGYFVQVAAVSKQEDANSLVEALKKKEYPAFVAASVSTDKLFRVQLGPYSEVKEAEGMRARLIADGYSPILKK
jgi:rare lipoprotein A